MKSIKQQYIDLREGNMTQANFMRNLRMTLPQYITNLSSFEDSVRILKNKGILTEADEKGKWTNTSGKSMYDQFSEINNLNGQEVLIGIDYEMIKNPELTKLEAQKIVIKNLKKNPIYYTAEDMSGVEGYEPEYIGGKSANPEAHQMQYLEKNMGNVVDKKRGMQPVKGIEKAKKDSDKGGETNKMEKGVSLMSLVAKSTRGVQKMDATGEKMKKVSVKENKVASTIFDKNANITKGVNKIAKEDDKKKSIKDKLKEMIRQELREMADGMEPMVRTGLDEIKLFADFSDSIMPKRSIESRFARSMSEVAREYDYLDSISLPDFFDEYEDGDDFYAGPVESLEFFKALPNEFVVTNNMNDIDESFMITKTGDDSFIAKEI